MTSNTILIMLWWLAILWTYTELFPRPFDDWKNTLLYIGVGIFVIARSAATKQSSVGKRDCHGPSLCEGPRNDMFFKVILISYLIICVASIVVAPSGQYEGLLELARLILWAGLAWVLAQSSSRTWVWLMRLTVVSAGTMGLLTWLQSRGADIWPYSGAFLTPIGHISYYGDFMALSLVMAVGLWGHDVIARSVATKQSSVPQRDRHSHRAAALRSRRDDTQVKSVTWLFCMFLIDLGLALSATRASLVGVIAGLLLAIPLVGYATRSFKKVAIIALIGVINLTVIFSIPVKSLRGDSAAMRLGQFTNLSQATIDTVSSGRWHTYVTSAHMAMERPLLGWGLGTFRFVYPEFAHRNARDNLTSISTWYMHPHNELLHQAVEVGFSGALLFLLGFAYLLYGGIRALRRPSQCGVGFTPGSPLKSERHCGDDGVLLITALCGLTAAFVSWQFSTNFLFPISRMMTALFAGIVLHVILRATPEGSQSTRRSFAALRMTTFILSTLLFATYQLSLICVNQRHKTTNAGSIRRYATWAVTLAPGAFDPLFARAGLALHTEPPAKSAPAVTALYENYPYVPAALHMMGFLRANQGNIPEARKLLQHALDNDPASSTVKQLLDQLPPEH